MQVSVVRMGVEVRRRKCCKLDHYAKCMKKSAHMMPLKKKIHGYYWWWIGGWTRIMHVELTRMMIGLPNEAHISNLLLVTITSVQCWYQFMTMPHCQCWKGHQQTSCTYTRALILAFVKNSSAFICKNGHIRLLLLDLFYNALFGTSAWVFSHVTLLCLASSCTLFSRLSPTMSGGPRCTFSCTQPIWAQGVPRVDCTWSAHGAHLNHNGMPHMSSKVTDLL